MRFFHCTKFGIVRIIRGTRIYLLDFVQISCVEIPSGYVQTAGKSVSNLIFSQIQFGLKFWMLLWSHLRHDPHTSSSFSSAHILLHSDFSALNVYFRTHWNLIFTAFKNNVNSQTKFKDLNAKTKGARLQGSQGRQGSKPEEPVQNRQRCPKGSRQESNNKTQGDERLNHIYNKSYREREYYLMEL